MPPSTTADETARSDAQPNTASALTEGMISETEAAWLLKDKHGKPASYMVFWRLRARGLEARRIGWERWYNIKQFREIAFGERPHRARR